ncbi:somatotropin-like [Gastrophryne carolinensis]
MVSGLCSSLGLLVILLLQSPPGFNAFPQMSLTNLFTNAVFRAHYLHQLVADSYNDYERSYIPKDQRNTKKNYYKVSCYSENIPAPTDKDNTHQKADMDLLRFSLTLLQSWMKPVNVLNSVFGSNQVISNIARVNDRLKDLEEGLHTLMRELDDGNVRNYDQKVVSYDDFDISLRSEDTRVKNYVLLSCFKKDMHKVETYLKVMKCRRFMESNCTI